MVGAGANAASGSIRSDHDDSWSSGLTDPGMSDGAWAEMLEHHASDSDESALISLDEATAIAQEWSADGRTLATLTANPDRLSRLVEDLASVSRAEGRSFLVSHRACSPGDAVSVSIGNATPEPTLIITDTGRGFDPDDAELIFRRLNRDADAAPPSP